MSLSLSWPHLSPPDDAITYYAMQFCNAIASFLLCVQIAFAILSFKQHTDRGMTNRLENGTLD
ncbi:hypothetical protein ES703_81493 [subsurface metagenome]